MIEAIFNRLFIAGVSLLLILPSILPSFILADFEINQDYIAQVLCIEKDIQESTCNGNCHLTEELKKVDENKKDTEILNSSEVVVWFVPQHTEDLPQYFLSNNELKFNIDQESKILSGFSNTLDHPPQA